MIISNNPEPNEWELYFADKTVRMALNRWVRLSGWQLVWDIDKDFPIESEVVLKTSFKDAVTTLVNSLANTDSPVQALFYEKSKTLRIVRYYDSKKNSQ
jgi:hypothetical protein